MSFSYYFRKRLVLDVDAQELALRKELQSSQPCMTNPLLRRAGVTPLDISQTAKSRCFEQAWSYLKDERPDDRHLFDCVLVMDFECTCFDTDSLNDFQEVIEFPAALVCSIHRQTLTE